MLRRISLISLLLLLNLLVWTGCRTRKAPPLPPEPVPRLLSKPELPQRGFPVSDFERLAHWKVETEDGTVQLRKNLSQSIWGRASAEIIFTPELPARKTVKLTPAEPWLIQSQFDTVLLWMLHDGSVGFRKDHQIRLRYRDATGILGEWILPYAPSSQMQMLHLRVPETIPTPVQVEALIWDLPASVSGPQNLYLDSLSIYQEVLSRIPQTVHYVRPFEYPPVFAPRRKNSVTLNFPTTPAAYRPLTRDEKSLQSLHRLEDGVYAFRYESKEMKLEYRISPAEGMPSVEVILEGETQPGLWTGAGLQSGEGAPTLRFSRMSGDKLLLQYTQGVQFELSLHGKTLQMDMNSLLENISSLDLGKLTPGPGRELSMLRFPLMRVSEENPWPVIALKSGTGTYLVSCFPDWWNSLASRWQPGSDTGIQSGFSLGRMNYEPRWRGTRNMFRERIYFTVSQRVQDVLPQPASPVAMYRQEMGNRQRGADRKIPQISLFSIGPLDPGWEDRILARDAHGEWREHPLGTGILLKPGLFDGWPLRRLVEFREQQTGDLLEVPAAAQFPPWRFMDYDVRSVGAATFSQTFAETGALLQQIEAEWGGGILSRGGAEWFWSGLVSAVEPEFPLGIQQLHPLLPHFAWWNVHPYTQILGLGRLDQFALSTDPERKEETLLNRALAFQVAYGALGRIPKLRNPSLTMKARRIQELLQPHFAGAQVERIAYWGNEQFLDAGEALAADKLRDSRLYIRLDNETEIWVNGDLFGDWQVRVDGREILLPPFGFVVRGNHLFVMNLPEKDQAPGLCLLETENQTWVSSPGRVVDELQMSLQGCLQVTRLSEGEVQIDVADWHGEARISAELLRLKQIGSLRAIDREGESVRDLHLLRDGSDWIFQSDSPLRRIWISEKIRGREMNFSP